MSDSISAVTRALLTLATFFACATLGAGLALFTGWPVAILSGIVGFVFVQQMTSGFARRRCSASSRAEGPAAAAWTGMGLYQHAWRPNR